MDKTKIDFRTPLQVERDERNAKIKTRFAALAEQYAGVSRSAILARVAMEFKLSRVRVDNIVKSLC